MHNKFTFVLYLFAFLLINACNSIPENENPIESTSLEPDSVNYELILHYKSEFDSVTQLKLEDWITTIYAATEFTLGNYPFDVHVYFFESNSRNSPVSFGQANFTDNLHKVNLYVNPDASLEELMQDWTAPHELSHLSIPFLGKSNKWFIEGYATFFSRQILMDMGYYTQSSFDSLYYSKIHNAKEAFNSDSISFIDKSQEVLAQHKYGTFYSAGSSFFMTIDLRLRKDRSMRFADLIKDYQECCRLTDLTIDQVVASFDQLIGEPWCSELLDVYRNKSANEALRGYN